MRILIRDITKASLSWKADSILSGDLYAVISILVIIVRFFLFISPHL